MSGPSTSQRVSKPTLRREHAPPTLARRRHLVSQWRGGTWWPIRAFAITGMVTAFWISLIIAGSDMRATPPSWRMSAGMRSSAITAHAPAFCAMIACAATITSKSDYPSRLLDSALGAGKGRRASGQRGTLLSRSFKFIMRRTRDV